MLKSISKVFFFCVFVVILLNTTLLRSFLRDANIHEINNWKIGFGEWCRKHQTKNLSYTVYGDKHFMKSFIRKIIPTMKVAKEYAYITNPENIDENLLRSLPSEYVFKATHLSGGIAIKSMNMINCVKTPCLTRKQKNNIQFLKNLCSFWLHVNYYNHAKELYYRDIKPMCIFEEMLGNSSVLMDYKIFTFHGKAYFIEVTTTRFLGKKRDFYTADWNRLNINLADDFKPRPTILKKPVFLKEMLDNAETIASKLRLIHVRVDFMAVADNYFFCELTFSHHACKGTLLTPLSAELFYGYVASNPTSYVDPNIVLQLV